jgi:hypothetical protein
MQSQHDPDIAAMNLSEIEKNGLQVYRNYSVAFEKHRAESFCASLVINEKAVSELVEVLGLIASEEPRALPVIACAYADDQLKEMFRREIPDGVPGGRGEMLSGFGPLSRLSQRVQMAYAFNWLSKDILLEVDHLRKVRNDVSHKWNIKLLETKLEQLINERQHPIEEYLGDGTKLPENFHELLSPQQKLRVRLVWLLGRLTYECNTWVPALTANLSPSKVLYGPHPPALLAQVSAACVQVTRESIIGAGV